MVTNKRVVHFLRRKQRKFGYHWIGQMLFLLFRLSFTFFKTVLYCIYGKKYSVFLFFFLIKWLNWDENNWIEKFSLLVLSCCTYPYPCLMFTGYMTGVFLQHLMKCQQLFTVSTDWTCLQLNTVLSTFVKQVGKTGSLNMCFCFVSFICSPIILYWFFNYFLHDPYYEICIKLVWEFYC